MSKKVRYGRKLKDKSTTPYSIINYLLFGTAVFVLVVGYWALAQKPVDGFLTMTLAPILLVIAYCVIIPVAIIFPGKKKTQERSHQS